MSIDDKLDDVDMSTTIDIKHEFDPNNSIEVKKELGVDGEVISLDHKFNENLDLKLDKSGNKISATVNIKI